MLRSRRPGLGRGRLEKWWVGGGPPGDGASLGRTSLQTGGVEGEPRDQEGSQRTWEPSGVLGLCLWVLSIPGLGVTIPHRTWFLGPCSGTLCPEIGFMIGAHWEHGPQVV